jgi:hypothetical protein
MIDITNWMVDTEGTNVLDGKSKKSRTNGKRNFKSKVTTLFKIMKTDNLIDIYDNPSLYLNRFKRFPGIQEENKKDYYSILNQFYERSGTLLKKYEAGDIPASINLNPSILRLQEIIPLQKIIVFKKASKESFWLAKEKELDRLENDAYYDWNQLIKVPDQIRKRTRLKTLKSLRQIVVLSIYLHENMLRDDLDQVLIKRMGMDIPANTNYIDLDDNRIVLVSYKTNKTYKTYGFTVQDTTAALIRKYLAKTERHTKKRPDYLITNNRGLPYAGLSSFISNTFLEFTKCKITINDLRHSLATAYMDENQRVREQLARRMHHEPHQHYRYVRTSGKVLDIPCASPSPANSGEDETPKEDRLGNDTTGNDATGNDAPGNEVEGAEDDYDDVYDTILETQEDYIEPQPFDKKLVGRYVRVKIDYPESTNYEKTLVGQLSRNIDPTTNMEHPYTITYPPESNEDPDRTTIPDDGVELLPPNYSLTPTKSKTKMKTKKKTKKKTKTAPSRLNNEQTVRVSRTRAQKPLSISSRTVPKSNNDSRTTQSENKTNKAKKTKRTR